MTVRTSQTNCSGGLGPVRGREAPCTPILKVTVGGVAHKASRCYFKPSFFPAASSSIDSRIRLSRVSGRLAM